MCVGGGGEAKRERESVCVCVCVCVSEREQKEGSVKEVVPGIVNFKLQSIIAAA